MNKHSSRPFPTNKDATIDKLMSPFQKFIRYEASSGIILIITILIALVWANLDSESYFGLWKTYFTISFDDFVLSKPLSLWINDLLMAIFFLLVGLEVKREMIIGELRNPKQAMLPISAALGGIVFPALIYIIMNLDNPDNFRGWAIPAATDIAFALGVLYLLGDRVPVAARVFLATLAIIDDIAAILIIAIFYTESIDFAYLFLAFGMFFILFLLNRINTRRLLPYVLIGSILWYGLFQSGIHATIAGIFLALTIPATTKINHIEFREEIKELIVTLDDITNDEEISPEELPIYMDTIAELEHRFLEIEAPLQRFEHNLAPWVAFVIMPIFALANAGVLFTSNIGKIIVDPLSLGIILGLSLGKPLGIFLTSYIAVKLKIAKLPSNLSWGQIVGIGSLAGIGFTMSTFISALAFENNPEQFEMTKIAILVASFLSGIVGYILLLKMNRDD